MNKGKQQVIDTFWVKTTASQIGKIFVTQEALPYYSGDTPYKKTLLFDSLDGPTVQSTDDPDIFLLPDGVQLKKIRREPYPASVP